MDGDLDIVLNAYGNRPTVKLTILGLVTSLPPKEAHPFDFTAYRSHLVGSQEKEFEAAFRSALIFATLNSELHDSEVKLIRKLAIAERTKKLRGRLSSPVILLTGTDLFSDGIAEKWKRRGGTYTKLSKRSFELTKLSVLADATQQLYLDLPPWF